MAQLPTPRLGFVFTVIVLAQFCGTSLWFAGNGVVVMLREMFNWPADAAGHLTSAVQFGFIFGTLIITLTGLTDKVSPSKVFVVSCLLGGLSNALLVIEVSSFPLAIASRIMTGISLGGIYPVGMKIAADWKKDGLGDWLGSLVGALVLGTALPHALTAITPLQTPALSLLGISILACMGGVVLFLTVPDGPYRRKSNRFSVSDLRASFRPGVLRSSMIGYFGHMWELYTFWAMVPWIVTRYYEAHQQAPLHFMSFIVIATGAVGCWAGGKISHRIRSAVIARTALTVSALCCLVSPLMWIVAESAFVTFLIIWGIAVITDSPQFSTMIASAAAPEIRGTVITFATFTGFAITIVSIQVLNYAAHLMNVDYLLCLLAAGPIAGLVFGRKPSTI